MSLDEQVHPQRSTHCHEAWPYRAESLHRSAKGAARTSRRTRNCFAPLSVLREFLRSRMPTITIITPACQAWLSSVVPAVRAVARHTNAVVAWIQRHVRGPSTINERWLLGQAVQIRRPLRLGAVEVASAGLRLGADDPQPPALEDSSKQPHVSLFLAIGLLKR